MPITIQHQLTATTPDNTSAEIRPSHWNSAHAVSISLAGNEVIKVIAAGGSTQSSGTVSFSNSNGVSFGLAGGVITASHDGITSQSVQTQGIQSISAGGNSVGGGQVVFSNSNGLSFGLNGSTITGSYTVPTQSAQSMGVYASSQTTGASSSSTVDARSLSIVGAGGVSVGLTNGSVVISGATGGGGPADGFNRIAAGTQTAGTLTTVNFANSNGITFGMSGSAQITASHNAITTQTVQTLGLSFTGNTTQNSSGTVDARSLQFDARGIVSAGFSNGSIVISAPDAASFTELSVGFSTGGNTAGTTGMVNSQMVLAGGANITLSGSTNGGSMTISVVGNAGAAGSAASLYAVSNTTQNSSATAALSALSFAGAGAVSVGATNGSIVISAAAGAQSVQTIGVYGSSQTTGQSSSSTVDARSITYRGAGLVSVGLSGGEVLISGGGLTTAALSNHSHGNPTLNLTNLSGTTASASNGLTLSLSAAAPTPASISAYAVSNTTQSSSGTIALSALSFAGAGAVSVGVTNNSVVISAAAGAQSAQTVGVYGVSNTTGASSSSTVDARSLSFQGAGGVSVGLTNGSVVISGATGGGAAVTASAANGSYTVGNLSFSNANGVSFGTSAGSAITASHNGLTTAAASNHSHGNPTLALTNLTGTTASASNGFTLSLSAAAAGGANSGTFYALSNTTVNSSGTVPMSAVSMRAYGVLSIGTSNGSLLFSTPDAVDFTQLSVGMSTQGNTAGDTGLFTGRMVFVGSNNITLSGSSNGGSATISIVGAGGGGGTGPSIAAGTQTASSGTVVFSNSNNVTFGLSGSTRLTASVGVGLYAVGNTTQASSTVRDVSALSFNAIGGATMGFSNGSIQVSIPAVSSLSATGAVSLSTNGSTVSVGVPQLSLYASSNTTAQSSSSSFSLGSLTLRGAGGVSVGFSGSEVVISGATGGAGAAVTASAANGSYTVGNLSFSNANGVSFGTSAGSAITASVAAQTNQTVGLYALGNTTQNSSSTMDARTLSFNALGAMTMGFSNGSVQVSAPATSSLSATGILSISTNGSTISLGVPGGTVSFWNPYEDAQTTASQIGNGSVFVQPAFNVNGNVSVTRLDLMASMSISSSSNSSHAGALSFNVGVYTRNGSTLSLATSGSQSYQWTNTSNNSEASINALRRFSIPLSANFLDGSDYWVAVLSRSSTTNANWFTASNVRVTMATGQVIGLIGEASNATKQLSPGFGLWSTTSTALPASIAFGDIRGIGSGVANNALPVFVNANNFTA